MLNAVLPMLNAIAGSAEPDGAGLEHAEKVLRVMDDLLGLRSATREQSSSTSCSGSSAWTM